MSAPRSAEGRGRGGVLAAVVAVVAILLVIVLGSRQPSGQPFDIRSSAPDGYRAITLLLRDRGAQVRRSSAAAVATDPGTGVGDVIVVPDPSLASRSELHGIRSAADRGATVVFATPTSDGVPGGDPDAGPDGVDPQDSRSLADTPAEPARRANCTIAALDGLGAIDTAFATPVRTRSTMTCYGGPQRALVGLEPDGTGQIITLASPYLLVNARLQPDKENGGQPLDNASLALRLFGPSGSGAGPGVRITVIDAVAGPDAVGGSDSLIGLVPLPVKLALAQGVLAFVLYAWWRARRLGRPVRERIPVEIAGSELVVAVGDLLRRKGTPGRAAAVLRSDARRELAHRLGVPPTAPPAALVEAVSQRTARGTDEVFAALADAPVGSADALVKLARTLQSLRQEVLHELPVA